MKKYIMMVVLALSVAGCTSLKQAMALKDCEYQYARIDNVSFMGCKTLTDMTSVQGALAISQALLGKSDRVPLAFTVHLKVTNPNPTTAAIEGLYYKVSLDDLKIADGNSTQRFEVVGQGTADMPLDLSMDLAQLLKTEERKALMKVLKNFIGLGGESTTVKVELKPTIKMGNRRVTSPAFIPMEFTYPNK